MNANNSYQVRSCNFDFHPVLSCESYEAALSAARDRGFDSRIECDGELVAVWSGLYGTHVYNRRLAGQPEGLRPIA